MLQYVNAFQMFQAHTDVYGRRLGSFEVGQGTTDVTDGPKLKRGPERCVGYEGRTPISTNLSGHD
jgi:hypothetical protein